MAQPPPKASPAYMKASALLAEAARLRDRGMTAEALHPTRQAAQLLPDDARVIFNLGLNFFEVGRPAEAVRALQHAMSLQPRFAEAAYRLGLARGALGDLAGAVAALQQAVDFKPSHAEARHRLGRLLVGLGRLDEAATQFKRARSSAGASCIGWMSEARLLDLAGDDAGKERAARRAVAADPGNPLAQEVMGGVHADAGRFAEAEQCFLRALDISPRMVGLWYDVARGRRLTEADRPLVARMHAAAALDGVDPGSVAMLQLAIGKALDDLGDPGGAMAAFDAAGASRAARLKFDLPTWRAEVEATIAGFTPDRLAAGAGWGSPDETPVLIVGLPRSGTTLVEQIISSHPDVAGGDELVFWRERVRMMEAAGGPGGPDEAFVAKAAADCLAVLRRLSPTARRITDKMPFNYLGLGLIHLAFPGARIIHCRRRLIDTALSIHQTWFTETLALPTGGEDLVGYCRAYEDLMDHWRRVLPADRFIEVDYQALTASPEPEIRRLVDFIGLDWDDACLHPEANRRVVKTASKWQARQPIHAGSVDRWRRFAPYLGPLAALADGASA